MQKYANLVENLSNAYLFAKIRFDTVENESAKNLTKIALRERCKGVHCVDLGESFPTSIFFKLLNLASIQQRTSPVKILTF